MVGWLGLQVGYARPRREQTQIGRANGGFLQRIVGVRRRVDEVPILAQQSAALVTSDPCLQGDSERDGRTHE